MTTTVIRKKTPRRRPPAKRARTAARKATPHTHAPSPPLEGWRIPGLDYPSFRISLVAKLINRLTAQQLAKASDLSFAEWRVLCRLALADGITVRDIAEKAWVDRAEVSRAAARLEQSGLAARRANPADERMPILFPTDTGKMLYKALISARSQFHSAIVDDLDKDERRVLDAALEKIMTRLLKMAKTVQD